MLQHGVPEENAPIHHVHVLHGVPDFIHHHLTVYGGNAVGIEVASEPLQPFSPEPLPLFRGRLWHRDDQVRGSVVEKEPLLEFGGILVRLNLIRQGLRLAQAPPERVIGVEVLHHEHIIHGHLHEGPGGSPDGVVGVVEVRGHLDPMHRNGPQLHRPPEHILLDDKIALAFEGEIDFQQPPEGGIAHFVQRVGVVPELQEGVLVKFLFLSILPNAV